ncbi:hypothetical protein IHE55_28605 [Streptomyces pactum]|uniref:Uncharacterized protein n=1 Tax=Streptomyces pactum TaxID=68249 RepID=A0ABS0NU07_9ACTN|nr:DUF5988 family protein [Streptomyces pactum]MBH5338524.1 hypothetical protein [Streptomyces pactum]
MTITAPNVLLRGGPVHLAEEDRMRHVAEEQSYLKLLTGNAYEHFRATQETVTHQGTTLRVFDWERRTYVAE